MKSQLPCLTVYLSLFCLGAFAQTNQANLRKDLLQHYDKHELPDHDKNGTTTVFLHLYIKNFRMTEGDQLFTLNAWLYLFWQDERLRWDKSRYGYINHTFFGDSELWKPDITLYNNADITEIDHYGNTNFLVEYDGYVHWFPPAKFTVECLLDLTFWPFDNQECVLYLGSWATHAWQLDFKPWFSAQSENQTAAELYGDYVQNHHWELKSAILSRKMITYEMYEPYILLEAVLKISRNSPFFCATVIIPAIGISLLTMVQFVLPFHHAYRSTAGSYCAALSLIVLLYLGYSLPTLATSPPVIVKFYALNFLMAVLSQIVYCITLVLSHINSPLPSSSPPSVLMMPLTGVVGRFLLLQRYQEGVGVGFGGTEDSEVLDKEAPNNYSKEWLLLAAAIDRICAIIIYIVFFISIMSFIAPVHG